MPNLFRRKEKQPARLVDDKTIEEAASLVMKTALALVLAGMFFAEVDTICDKTVYNLVGCNK